MDDDQAAESRVGTMLRGKWRLERLLGVGGMAAVYEATHRIGRRDAIKILHPSVARSAELRARFEQEAHAVNHFTHPGAVEIRDIDTTDDGAPFLVMELLEGEPLSQRVGRPGGLGTEELLRLTDELLDVLAAAHAQGIIHRDVKPDNLFVLADGRLKVLDFGIARMREGSSKANRTAVGMRLGTLPYMPPEQIRGQAIDARADLFAVGAMLFRLVAGRRVHEAPSEAEIAAKMVSEQAPALASVAPATPEGICLVVDRALAFDREQRYPDAATMQADVRAVSSGLRPPYAAEALARTGAPRVVRTPTAVVSASAPGGALADAPTSAESPGASRPASLPEAPTRAAAMEGALGGALADAPTSAESPGAAPPGSLAEAPTRAASPTAVSPTATTVPASAASARVPVLSASSGTRAGWPAAGTPGAVAAAVGPATLVSPGMAAGAAVPNGAAGPHTVVSGAMAASAPPSVAVVEAPPASFVDSAVVPTQPVAVALGVPAQPLAGGYPTGASPAAAGATGEHAGGLKPVAILWLALGASLMTLAAVLVLWWAFSSTGTESESAAADDPSAAGSVGEAQNDTSEGARRAGTDATARAVDGASANRPAGGTPAPTSPTTAGAGTVTTGSTPLTTPPSLPNTSGTAISPPSTESPVPTSGGKGNKDKDKDKGKGKGHKK